MRFSLKTLFNCRFSYYQNALNGTSDFFWAMSRRYAAWSLSSRYSLMVFHLRSFLSGLAIDNPAVASLEELDRRLPGLDVVLHSQVDMHKKSLPFLVFKKWEAVHGEPPF